MTTERSGMSLDLVVAFLLGEGELDGVWFGEKHERRRGSFWWREILRDAYTAHLSRDAVVSDEGVDVVRDNEFEYWWKNDQYCIAKDRVGARDRFVWNSAWSKAIESLAARHAALPDGYVLVPVEPTEAMIHAGASSHDYPSVYMGGPSEQGKRTSKRIYKAMLAQRDGGK